MSQLLSGGTLQKIRVDLTTKCNLRCVYCALSQSTWQGEDMPMPLAQRATAAILELSRHHPLDEVHINGHGETTFLEGWDDVCRSLLDQDIPLFLTTNLAKQYSQAELEVLARMSVIAISIDSCDPDLLKRMRRKVDVRQIVMNIQMIRATALRLDTIAPDFQFSCGLYDQNSLFIEDLARFAIALRIQAVGFWNLATWHHEEFPYENTDVPEPDRAFPLDTLSPEELRPRLDAIKRAVAILHDNGVTVQINGDFIGTLSNQCERVSEEPAALDGLELPQGMTRDCIDPWIYAELDTNGDVKPCCARGSVGNLARSDLSHILDDEPIRRVRANLLNATNDESCTKCPLRPPTRPELLQQRVRALLENRAVQARGMRSNSRSALWAFRKAANLLRSALADIQAGRRDIAWQQLGQALAIDPGIRVGSVDEGTIRTHLETIVAKTQSPGTLTWLAAICREIGDREAHVALLKRYVQLAPDAPDGEHVRADIIVETAEPKPTPKILLQQTWFKLRTIVQLRTRGRRALDVLRRKQAS